MVEKSVSKSCVYASFLGVFNCPCCAWALEQIIGKKRLIRIECRRFFHLLLWFFFKRSGLGLRLLVPPKRIVVFDINSKNSDVCAGLFSPADRCFPRARLQPPRETHSAGSSDTCCSRRSQRSSAPNSHCKSKIDPIVRCQTPS